MPLVERKGARGASSISPVRDGIEVESRQLLDEAAEIVPAGATGAAEEEEGNISAVEDEEENER